MPLNDLDQPELERLIDALLKVGEATQPLHRDGLNPRINLTPGNKVRITLDYRMPEHPTQFVYVGGYLDPAAGPEVPIQPVDLMDKGESVAEPTPVPPRDWHEGEEHQVAEIYARNRIETPMCDPAVEAGKLLGRLPGVVRAYVTAHLYPLCDQHLERLRTEPDEAAAVTAEAQPTGGNFTHDPEDEIDERAFASAAPSRSADADLPQVSASAEGAAESGGGQGLAAPEPPAAPIVKAPGLGAPVRLSPMPLPPAAPVPGSASALAAATLNKFGQKKWTADEDARLVDLVATGMVRLGLGKSAAIRAAATELGRPEPGTGFRCHNVLKARIDEAAKIMRLAAETTDRALAATADPVRAIVADGTEAVLPADLDARSRAAAIEHGTHPDAPPVKPEHIADEVTGHLMTLPDKGGWTLDRDLELMELSIAGWKPNEIALQLQVQASAVGPRWDLLSGLYEDANGKKVRRFTREQVFAALSRMAGKAA